MVKKEAENAREKVIRAGTELIRRNGYVATTVDEICAEAGVTKGAFFHYFASKEALAEACLDTWTQNFMAMIDSAPFHSINDPMERLVGCMDFFIGALGNPQFVKSCLAGTVVQEVSESHPALRAGRRPASWRASSGFANCSMPFAGVAECSSIRLRSRSCGWGRFRARFCWRRLRAMMRLSRPAWGT